MAHDMSTYMGFVRGGGDIARIPMLHVTDMVLTTRFLTKILQTKIAFLRSKA